MRNGKWKIFAVAYLSSFFLLFTLNSLVQSQQPAPPLPGTAQTVEEVGNGDIVRITANLVSVPVTVINRQCQYVAGLHQNDFRVYEDGVEQTIAHFSDVDRPFSVVLLMDTSGSTSTFLDQIKRAA